MLCIIFFFAVFSLLASLPHLTGQVTKHLSESETLFMQDGALGSHRSVETRLKVLTNDAAIALYMKYAYSKSLLVFLFYFIYLVTYYRFMYLSTGFASQFSHSAGTLSMVLPARPRASAPQSSSTTRRTFRSSSRPCTASGTPGPPSSTSS
jgi:hypothetical protein